MAYVNVAEWKTDQVCEWLKGLDNSVLPYVHSFTNNKVNGQQLLSLRPEDLEQLGVLKVGHQEIILEAVEYLRNFHYELDRENLQLLALRLACQAHSLHNELFRQTDSKPVATQTLSDVVGVVTSVKPLVRWLDKPPFSGQAEYNDRKTQLLKLSIEMATCAQRDRFAEKPIEEIRATCDELAQLADYIIRDISDPMILQPASLDLATLKKRPGDDLGFYILPSFHGTHQIAEVKFSSVAHQCAKMEEGDEIVQVNYQTVVGWGRKNVLELFNESPMEVLLTLKRRPRHTKVYGQIYIKPYRLPSNKKTPYATRWQHNLPSPRPELLTIPDFTIPLPRHAPKDPSPAPASTISTVNILDAMASDSSDSDGEVEPPLSSRLYASKPRILVQRRATITGASPTTKHAIDIEQFWKELQQEHSTTFQLRDKAASCALGLDIVPSAVRPQTCLGIEQSKRKKRLDGKKEASEIVSKNKVKPHKMECTEMINVSKYSEKKSNINTEMGEMKDHCHSSISSAKQNSSDTTSNIHDIDINYSPNTRKYYCNDQGKLEKSSSVPVCNVTGMRPTEINPCDISSLLEDTHKKTNGAAVGNTDTNWNEKNFKTDTALEMIESIQVGIISHNIDSIENKFRKDIAEQHVNGEVLDAKTSCTNPSSENLKNDQDEAVEIISSNPKGSLTPSKIIQAETRNCVDYSSKKTELIGSHPTEIYPSNSETSVPLVKFKQSSLPLTENNKISDINTTAYLMTSMDIFENMYVRSDLKENLSPQVTVLPSIMLKLDTKTEKYKKESRASSLTCIESTQCRRSDNKVHSTPPEPPLRQDVTNPPPLNLNVNSISSQLPERRRVLLPHLNSEREMHEVVMHSTSEPVVPSNQRDTAVRCHDFLEKSTDFVNASISSAQERRSFGYSKTYDNHTKENKSVAERYEPFIDKFGNGKTLMLQRQSQNISHTTDSPDGAGYSTQTPGLKSGTLEKDKHSEKGVVNRAMMVARSIGLQSSSKMSSNSPRSNRKRSMLLAKRRNVSVKDIGAGELEGWLTYRSRGAGGAWAKSWFVLKGSSLYRFETFESIKSDCLIVLTGFTASKAPEVKSRKFAFKVYHTGTVFYFAADTEDYLLLWLDCINKATLGVDCPNRMSGLFSETDDSDTESSKDKSKNTGSEFKQNLDNAFGSLKKVGKKNSEVKNHEIGGTSLDRKYLRFLRSRTQNVPVPTAQFRSYRRVLPLSTTNKKLESTSTSPDLRVMVAGSTFYALTSSHSSTDMPTSGQDMEDYRQTTDRRQSSHISRRQHLPDFITLEEFMLSHRQNAHQHSVDTRSASSRVTPLTNDHIRLQYYQFDPSDTLYLQNRSINSDFSTDGMTYAHQRDSENSSPLYISAYSYTSSSAGTSRLAKDESIYNQQSKSASAIDEAIGTTMKEGLSPILKKSWNQACKYVKRPEADIFKYSLRSVDPQFQNGRNEFTRIDSPLLRSISNSSYMTQNKTKIDSNSKSNRLINTNTIKNGDFHRKDILRFSGSESIKNIDYPTSSGLLTHSSGTLARVGKETSESRQESFNTNDQSGEDGNNMESLRLPGRKLSSQQKVKLKSSTQYQPPPIHSSPFEYDRMTAAFEMQLDKEHVQKTNKLKNFFGGRNPQKPMSLDLPKEQQKTLLGSPRLHRALFKDKSSSQKRSESHSPRDSGVTQCLSFYSGMSRSDSHTLSQCFSSVSSPSGLSMEASPMNSDKFVMEHGNKKLNSRHLMYPPILPYIPPPSSPPPDDYPGLEYPPVFEPGTYSLSAASLMSEKSEDLGDSE